MEKSKLENISNVKLFFLLKYIVENYDYNVFDFDDIGNDRFLSLCGKASLLVGITNIDYIDYNYILSILILNKKFDFTTKKPEGTLVRPSVGLYSFDIDEHRTEYVRRTYNHEIESYLPELIEPMIGSMENEGDFDYYDGHEADTDYYDGETTDINFDKRSIRKIK